MLQDPARPYVLNDEFRVTGRQPTAELADLNNPILQPWARDVVRKRNELVLAGQPVYAPHSSLLAGRSRRRLLGLRAGGDERIVGGVAGAAGRGPLGREGGRVSHAAAIGDEEHFVIAALRHTAGRIAAGAHDPHRARRPRRPGRPGVALGARRTGRSRIALLAGKFSAAREASRQRNGNQRPIHSRKGCSM